MGSKSKKRKANAHKQQKRKAKKDRKQKLKATHRTTPAIMGKRHRQQLERLIPRAWPDEATCDVALFDDQILAELPSEEQADVRAVREALKWIARENGVQAEQCVAGISRKSRLSEWRVWIRGLKSWLEGDLVAAAKAWIRLDPQRRPARIAATLQLAHRDDLASWDLNSPLPTSLAAAGATSETTTKQPAASESAASESAASPEPDAQSVGGSQQVALDEELVRAAKVVRRMRIERAAIKIAATGVHQKMEFEDEIPGTLLTPLLIEWLVEFGRDFRETEPRLVRALELAALDRAVNQGYFDIFEEAAASLPGPAHDPDNHLRGFYFHSQRQAAENASDEFERYLEWLMDDGTLPKPLRHAMLSKLSLTKAEGIQSRLRKMFPPIRFFRLTEERAFEEMEQDVRRLFEAAVLFYPANDEAHRGYVSWIRSRIDDDFVSKDEREKLEADLLDAMKNWSQSLPNESEPRLYLVDRLLEDNQLQEAEEHIQWLVNSRQDSPLIRSLPWKLKLMQATEMCRRKSDLDKVPAILEEVDAEWPQWLSRRWFPYFKAAWLLRRGCRDEYEEQRQHIVEQSGLQRDSLADACMMLGAAQRMRVAAADLKPLRQPVDAAVKKLEEIDTEQLIVAGGFFWSMHQSEFSYPAFRMHGSKFGREFLNRISQKPCLVSERIADPDFRGTVLWCSERRFFSTNDEVTFPEPLRKLEFVDPFVTAARVNSALQTRYRPRIDPVKSSEFLRKAANSKLDAFYRYWFKELADEVECRAREWADYYWSPAFNDDEDEDSDELFDWMSEDSSQCDCESCRAQRAAAAQ